MVNIEERVKGIRCHIPMKTLDDLFSKLFGGIYSISTSLYPCQRFNIVIKETDKRVYISIVLDKIKIDQSYIRDVASEENKKEVLTPTIEFWKFEK